MSPRLSTATRRSSRLERITTGDWAFRRLTLGARDPDVVSSGATLVIPQPQQLIGPRRPKLSTPGAVLAQRCASGCATGRAEAQRHARDAGRVRMECGDACRGSKECAPQPGRALRRGKTDRGCGGGDGPTGNACGGAWLWGSWQVGRCGVQCSASARQWVVQLGFFVERRPCGSRGRGRCCELARGAQTGRGADGRVRQVSCSWSCFTVEVQFMLQCCSARPVPEARPCERGAEA